jgi:hypothetical protein
VVELQCPCCGAGLKLALAQSEESDHDIERADAWARAEEAALLREAERGE